MQEVENGELLINTGVPNLQDLMTDGLRRSRCNNNGCKVHNKWNVLESSWNHPPPPFLEKLSSTKPVSGAKKVGDRCPRPSEVLIGCGMVTQL